MITYATRGRVQSVCQGDGPMVRPSRYLRRLALPLRLGAAVGPIFHFSDTRQLIINTATTVLTFLVVFLIQNTQNRDAAAMHLKLDELIRAVEGARNRMVDLEDVTDEELERLKVRFAEIGATARNRGEVETDAQPR